MFLLFSLYRSYYTQSLLNSLTLDIFNPSSRQKQAFLEISHSAHCLAGQRFKHKGFVNVGEVLTALPLCHFDAATSSSWDTVSSLRSLPSVLMCGDIQRSSLASVMEQIPSGFLQHSRPPPPTHCSDVY